MEMKGQQKWKKRSFKQYRSKRCKISKGTKEVSLLVQLATNKIIGILSIWSMSHSKVLKYQIPVSSYSPLAPREWRRPLAQQEISRELLFKREQQALKSTRRNFLLDEKKNDNKQRSISYIYLGRTKSIQYKFPLGA